MLVVRLVVCSAVLPKTIVVLSVKSIVDEPHTRVAVQESCMSEAQLADSGRVSVVAESYHPERGEIYEIKTESGQGCFN